MFCSAALQVNWLIEVQDSRLTRGRAAASVVPPSPNPRSLFEMKERKIKEEKAVGMDGWGVWGVRGHILLVKQRGAVLEVIRRLNPVKCVQAHRVFLRDNSCLFQCVSYFIYLFIFISPSWPDNIVLLLKWDFTFISSNEDELVTVNPWWSWKCPRADGLASLPARPASTCFPFTHSLAHAWPQKKNKTTKKQRRHREAYKHSWISMRLLMDGYLLQITQTTEQKAFFLFGFFLPRNPLPPCPPFGMEITTFVDEVESIKHMFISFPASAGFFSLPQQQLYTATPACHPANCCWQTSDWRVTRAAPPPQPPGRTGSGTGTSESVCRLLLCHGRWRWEVEEKKNGEKVICTL